MSFVDKLNEWNKSEAEQWRESHAKAVERSQAMLAEAEGAEAKARKVSEELMAAEAHLGRSEQVVARVNPGDKGWKDALGHLQDATTLVAAHKARLIHATEEARKKRMHYETYGQVVTPASAVRAPATAYGDGFVPDSVFLG